MLHGRLHRWWRSRRARRWSHTEYIGSSGVERVGRLRWRQVTLLGVTRVPLLRISSLRGRATLRVVRSLVIRVRTRTVPAIGIGMIHRGRIAVSHALTVHALHRSYRRSIIELIRLPTLGYSSIWVLRHLAWLRVR